MGVADAFDRVCAALPKSCPLETLSMKDLNKVDSFSFLGRNALALESAQWSSLCVRTNCIACCASR